MAVGIGLLFVLGPFAGPIGAAAASSAGYVVTLMLMLNGLGLRVRAVLPKRGDLRAAAAVFVGGRL